MKIGELAKKTNIAVSKIRYYDNYGLLQSARTQGQYRVYDEQSEAALQFVVFLQSLNFPLEEIKNIMNLMKKDNQSHKVSEILSNKKEVIEEEIRRFRNIGRQLESLATNIHSQLVDGINGAMAGFTMYLEETA